MTKCKYLLIMCLASQAIAADITIDPVKVFILAGQSNMEASCSIIRRRTPRRRTSSPTCATVTSGRCAIDLPNHQDKPEARQLLYSLLRYVDSAAFAPQAELDAGLLKKLLPWETL